MENRYRTNLKKVYLSDQELIFYFGSDRNEFDFYFSNEDPLITYDSNQEPIYSGVYFSRPENSKSLFKLTNSNIPEEIWEGKLIIGR